MREKYIKYILKYICEITNGILLCIRLDIIFLEYKIKQKSFIWKILASHFKLFIDFYFLLILQFASVTLELTSRINHNS